ncbi:MAG: response regulator [Myxococcales bacterium]|nr:response regulator [Myxococcales bacterium]
MNRTAVADLAEALDLTPPLVDERLRAIGLGPAERARLRAMAPAATAATPRFLESFYARLQETPATRDFLRTPEIVAHLKEQHRHYIEELFTAEYDWEHALRCLHIGMVHHRIHLTPQWFVASYGLILAEYIPRMFTGEASLEEALERVVALVASVVFDASLVLDGYAMSSASSIRESLAQRPRSTEPSRATSATGESSARRPAATRTHVASDDAEERRLFLGIDDDVREALSALAPAVERAIPSVVEEFYDFFTTWPETRDLVPPSVVERLRRQVGSYWSELVRSPFDRSYAASRTLVGIVHERVGLSSPLYLVGVARQVTSLLRRAVTSPAGADALVRSVFFDTSFVIQAYLDARAAALLRTDGFGGGILASLLAGVAVVDARLRVDFVNPALLAMFGLDARLVRHVHIAQLLPFPEVVPLLRRAWDDPLASRATSVVSRDGRTFRMSAVRLEGAAARVALVLDDVSELQHLGDDVRDDEQTYSDVLEAVETFAWELDDASATLSMVSRSVVRVSGHRDVALLGRRRALFELLPEPDRAAFERACAGLRTGGRFEITHRLRRPDGEIVWLRSRVARHALAGGKTVLRGTSVDVTAQHLAEQLRLDAVGKLAGGIAHEYNNQLTVVLSSLALMEEGGGTVDTSLLAYAAGAAEHCAALTRRLLAFAQRQILQPRRLVVSEWLGRTRPTLATYLGQRVELDLRLDADVWPVNVDARELEAALGSVLTNASESMPSGGRVTVKARNLRAEEAVDGAEPLGGDFVEIAVEDGGVGMEEGVRKRAFDPFFTTKATGTGLGLSLVHGFVAQSGGRVVLASERGKGTVVRLLFPRAPVDATSPGERREGARVVLVVDDEPAVLRMMTRLIARLGCSTMGAHSVDDALGALEAVRPDVLVTDVVLAHGENGARLAEQARARIPDLPIVFVSGYPRENLDLAALGEREWFVPKPFPKGALEEAVKAALLQGARAAS